MPQKPLFQTATLSSKVRTLKATIKSKLLSQNQSPPSEKFKNFLNGSRRSSHALIKPSKLVKAPASAAKLVYVPETHGYLLYGNPREAMGSEQLLAMNVGKRKRNKQYALITAEREKVREGQQKRRSTLRKHLEACSRNLT